jgi:hypothetical protein
MSEQQLHCCTAVAFFQQICFQMGSGSWTLVKRKIFVCLKTLKKKKENSSSGGGGGSSSINYYYYYYYYYYYDY